MTTKREYAIAIHCGAGTVSKQKLSEWKKKAYQEALRRALQAGESILKKGGKSLDAVMEAVMVMEDSSLFNAGKGSVFTSKGEHEMDASIMDGKNLKSGLSIGYQGGQESCPFCKDDHVQVEACHVGR